MDGTASPRARVSRLSGLASVSFRVFAGKVARRNFNERRPPCARHLRARMIEDMSLAGLATGTQKIYVQSSAADWPRITVDRPICSARKKFGAICSACASAGWRANACSRPAGSAFAFSITIPSRLYMGTVRGKKGSPRHDRNGCLTRCQRIRSGNCSGVSATRFTRPASPSCMRVACASARPPPSRLAPSTGPIRCCASSARANKERLVPLPQPILNELECLLAHPSQPPLVVPQSTRRRTGQQAGAGQTPSPPPPRPRGIYADRVTPHTLGVTPKARPG